MNRHPFRTWALAGSLALLASACSEADSPLPSELAPPSKISVASAGAQDQYGYATKCMEDIVEQLDGSNSVPLNCTANDMNLFITQAAGGSELPLCLPGELLPNLAVEAHVSSSANQRYDIGLWIRSDNQPIADALRGDCRHWALVPTSTAATVGDTREAPFWNADGDNCGDLQQGVTSILKPITLTNLICQDTDSDGFLDIGACVAYDNNANTAAANCSDPAAAVASTRPNTKSKCKCGPVNVPVRIAGKIRVEKVTVPSGDAQTFSFSGDLSGSIAHGGFIEELVEAGNYSVTEAVQPGWDLTNISCTTGGTGSVATRTASFNVAAGQTVTCTFTNTKQASVTIRKVTVPAESPAVGSFSFTQDFDGTGNFSLGHNQTKVFSNIVAGVAKTVVEADPTPGYDLTGITCTGASTWTGTVATRTLNVTPQAGETITCTFTNTKRATAIVKKVMVGGTGTFSFTGTPNGSINTNNGTISAQNLVPGQFVSTEAAAPGWELQSVVCDDANSVGSVAGRTATFNLEAGETVTCTFTNRRLAVIVVEKLITGGGAQIFDFTRAPSASFSLGHGQTNSSGRTLAPNTYRVCELDLAVSWSASATINGNPASLINPDAPADEGNRCVDVVVQAGDSAHVTWTNSPPPTGGDARTIGYWRNWSSCTNGKQFVKAPEKGMADKTLDANLPQTVGILTLTSCQPAVYILSKRDLGGTNRANDAAYSLAAQLLAAKLNQSAGADVCAAAATAITQGQALLASINFDGTGQYLRPQHALYAQALALADTLDKYNNNTLCGP